tara:strand:+ start:7577 stop:9481 length:1905 start_codon:yes stop_codon:yes gene_type:complete
MKLIKAEIFKYKSIEQPRDFVVEEDITILVGMNESGKTSILEALAKTNYFQDDEDFKFNAIHDYPRREKKELDKSGVDPTAITCTYKVDDELKTYIDNNVGENVFTNTEVEYSTKYSNKSTWGNVTANLKGFIDLKTKELGISSTVLNEKLYAVKNETDLDTVINGYKDEELIKSINTLRKFLVNSWKWDNPISEYIARLILKPALPKFLYYDEYYSLPPRINIEKLEAGELEGDEYKTAQSLFELADINTKDLLGDVDFEAFQAELEATQANISDTLFKYWTANTNLDIEFKIDKVKNDDDEIEHILDIRVKNSRTRVSLSLKNRSKGFNWFFSFLVWFKKIQEDKNSKYILLLDEPGLNLHASAQNNLLDFFEDLGIDYQIIYSTHSPFMITSEKLDRVRTVYESEEGTIISDSVQEKDPNTLFPLQAALGYDIAQNLFITEKNLLVEGVSDLIYLQSISGYLESKGHTFLKPDITIVPVGGLDKVGTFISLMRGQKLKMVCLLDTFTDAKSKAKLDSMVQHKIIQQSKICFFDQFLEGHTHADIEDLFSKKDYLTLFNGAFTEYADIKEAELDTTSNQVLQQICTKIGKPRFNHYRPANYLSKIGIEDATFETDTLDKFEEVFKKMNSLFK